MRCCARLEEDAGTDLWRRSLVCEKRGDHRQAARYYRQAGAFMDEHEGYDDELKVWARERADELDPPAT